MNYSKEISKDIYEQEMQHGYIDLGLDKVVMFGIAGSGKTCSLHALLELSPPDPGSTPLMNRPIDVQVISSDDGKQWKKMTREEVHKRIAQIIRSRPIASPSSEHTNEHTTNENTNEHTNEHTSENTYANTSEHKSNSHTGEQSSNTTARKPHLPAKEGSNIASKAGASPPPASEERDTPRPPSISSLVRQMASEVQEDYISQMNALAPSHEEILKQDWVYLIDSGGQHAFHEVLPIFLNGASDFIYVFKLNDPLDKPPMISYRDSTGKPISEPCPSFLTNEEIFRRCMRTIYSFLTKNDSRPPQILILGTHRDKVKEGELPKIQESVRRIVEETKIKDQVIFNGENYVFPINAKEPMKEDRECTKACRDILDRKHGMRREKVPLRWFALEDMMQKVAKILNRKVLSKHECLEIAKSLHINDELSCKEALKFFSNLNLLFYWPDILPDLVFLEPEVILDKVSELVKERYQMKTTPSPRGGEWHNFRDHAKVTEAMLNEFKGHYVYEEQMFTPKKLITLFVHLLVFAKLPNDAWFMPSLLDVVPKEELIKSEQYRVRPETAMVIHFPDDRPKIGMFCCMIASVLSSDTKSCCMKVLKESGKPKCIKRNVIKLEVEHFAGYVLMIDHFTHFEVYVRTHQDDESKLWELIQSAVFTGLKKACDVLGYADKTPETAIVCPEHPSSPHPATIKGKKWKCSETACFGVIEQDIPWRKNEEVSNSLARGEGEGSGTSG